jgi:hypothetical protein
MLKNHKDMSRLVKTFKEFIFPLYFIFFLNKKEGVLRSFLEKYKKGFQKMLVFWLFLALAFSYFSGTLINFLGHSFFGLNYTYSIIMLTGFFYFQLIKILQNKKNFKLVFKNFFITFVFPSLLGVCLNFFFGPTSGFFFALTSFLIKNDSFKKENQGFLFNYMLPVETKNILLENSKTSVQAAFRVILGKSFLTNEDIFNRKFDGLKIEQKIKVSGYLFQKARQKNSFVFEKKIFPWLFRSMVEEKKFSSKDCETLVTEAYKFPVKNFFAKKNISKEGINKVLNNFLKDYDNRGVPSSELIPLLFKELKKKREVF